MFLVWRIGKMAAMEPHPACILFRRLPERLTLGIIGSSLSYCQFSNSSCGCPGDPWPALIYTQFSPGATCAGSFTSRITFWAATPMWVPPLMRDDLATLDPRNNPVQEDAENAPFHGHQRRAAGGLYRRHPQPPGQPEIRDSQHALRLVRRHRRL